MFGKIMSAPLFGSSPNIRENYPNFHKSFSPLSGHPIHNFETYTSYDMIRRLTSWRKQTLECTLLFKSNGIFVFRWQNMVFIFKVHTWNFVCGIRRSFAFTMENILSVWYTATPGWTSKFGKVWKTHCQNAATRANIWRCFLVSWDDKYLWVKGSNNRHELYFCSK